MKRSEVNDILLAGAEFFRSFGYVLPPFAHWSPDRLRAEDHAVIAARGLGWDITDFGLGDFATTGLFLFTARNGRIADLETGGGMVYAEKIMITRDGQVTPSHRHHAKTEDIINRGGGRLVLELWTSGSDGRIDRKAPVALRSDGLPLNLAPGAHLVLEPGQSVTLTPNIWHSFWGEGDVLVGEVSTVNDDLNDNWFVDGVGRFARIDEDTRPVHLLVSDYAEYLGTAGG